MVHQFKKIDLNKKNILITGASGFIGANLLRKITVKFPQARPHIIIRETSNTWRIKNILKKVKVYSLDLQDKKAVESATQEIKPDIIFHLATYGAYPKQNSLEEAVQTNILGLKNLLLALEKIDYELFINTGTSSEYGYKKRPMKETDCLEPTTFYAATKGSAFHICTAYGFINRRPIVTLRLFSIYGPYEEPGRFISTAILKALADENIEVVKRSMRDFVYVEDVVDAYLACVKLRKFDQGVINICSGIQTSINKTARLIVKLTKSKSKIKVGVYKPRQWDTNYWVGENLVAKKILKWKPEHDLKKGLLETIKWFKKNKNLYG